MSTPSGSTSVEYDPTCSPVATFTATTRPDLDTPALHPHVTTAFEARYTRPGDQPYLPRADPCFDVLDLIGSATATLTATAGVTDHR